MKRERTEIEIYNNNTLELWTTMDPTPTPILLPWLDSIRISISRRGRKMENTRGTHGHYERSLH